MSPEFLFWNILNDRTRKERLCRSKILLDTDQKIILDHQNNFVGTLKIMSIAAKNFNILAIDRFI